MKRVKTKRYKGVKGLVKDALKKAFMNRDERMAKMLIDYKKVLNEQKITHDKIMGRVGK